MRPISAIWKMPAARIRAATNLAVTPVLVSVSVSQCRAQALPHTATTPAEQRVEGPAAQHDK